MENVAAFRLLTSLLMMATMSAGILAVFFMKFPDNVAVIAFSAAATLGVVFFVKKKEKSAKFKVYYQTVQEFGTPVLFAGQSGAFERNGTRFDIDFPQGEHSLYFKVNFYIPKVWEKFSIQNRNFQTAHHEDCRIIEDSPLPPEYLLQSRDPDFLTYLLGKRHIRDEVLNYKASFWGRTSISFEDGAFEMIWTPPLSEQIEGFYNVCQTAVVFHDELRSISGKR